LPTTATNGAPARSAVSNSARWKPIVPSPSIATTVADGHASLAATANGSEAPMAPDGPLVMRRALRTHACDHWPNSPPSVTSTASRRESIKACTAAHTRSGCTPRAASLLSSRHAGG
jgi:hypothetical protein